MSKDCKDTLQTLKTVTKHLYIYHLNNFKNTTVCLKKNIPNIFSCNSRKHCRIFIMFGTRVTEKVSNQ